MSDTILTEAWRQDHRSFVAFAARLKHQSVLDAEDLVQAAYVTLARHPTLVRGLSPEERRRVLYHTVRFMASNHNQQRFHVRSLMDLIREALMASPDPEALDPGEVTRRNVDVRRAVQALPPVPRYLVHRLFWLGLTFKEVETELRRGLAVDQFLGEARAALQKVRPSASSLHRVWAVEACPALRAALADYQPRYRDLSRGRVV